MTGYSMASATIAFDDVVWPKCGVVLRDDALIFNRDTELDVQTWAISNVHVNGPRMYLATRDDGKLISIINAGGCGCR